MLNFCTLFNSFYLTRALAMHQSLLNSGAEFHLFMFTFDDKSYEMITELNLRYVTVVSQEAFENEHLRQVKKERELHEYLWTCTPWTVGYVLDNFDVDHCTYIDADIFFFSNPKVLLDELDGKSVLITEHRYTKKYDQSKRSGVYCVQFVTFKNNTEGKRVLNWWMERCLEWCFDRVEDGKFGDQKYLDGWPEKFEGVHVLKHLGGGVAPWNIQQYTISMYGDQLVIQNGPTEENVVFFHFHDIKFYENDKVDLGIYKLRPKDLELLYFPYFREILIAESTLKNRFKFDRQTQRYFYYNAILTPLHRIVRIILNVYNIFDLNKTKHL